MLKQNKMFERHFILKKNTKNENIEIYDTEEQQEIEEEEIEEEEDEKEIELYENMIEQQRNEVTRQFNEVLKNDKISKK